LPIVYAITARATQLFAFLVSGALSNHSGLTNPLYLLSIWVYLSRSSLFYRIQGKQEPKAGMGTTNGKCLMKVIMLKTEQSQNT